MTILIGAMLSAIAVPPPPGAIIGQWGGNHVELDVTAREAILKLDCGAGRFSMPVSVDRNGSFVSAGTLSRYGVGPTHADELSEESKASYRGHIAHDELTLIVSAGGQERAKTYRLRRNTKVRFVRCM